MILPWERICTQIATFCGGVRITSKYCGYYLGEYLLHIIHTVCTCGLKVSAVEYIPEASQDSYGLYVGLALICLTIL